jgi:hypothetical protein
MKKTKIIKIAKFVKVVKIAKIVNIVKIVKILTCWSVECQTTPDSRLAATGFRLANKRTSPPASPSAPVRPFLPALSVDVERP